MAATAAPEITTTIAHLRDVLGKEIYESFAHKGATMTTAKMVTYAYDQIDQARTELNTASKLRSVEGPKTPVLGSATKMRKPRPPS